MLHLKSPGRTWNISKTGTDWYLSGERPSGYDLDFEPLLYNHPDFLELRTALAPTTFYLCCSTVPLITGSISFFLKDSRAINGHLAPFGSFDLSPRVSQAQLHGMLVATRDRLVQHRVGQISIRHYPDFYGPSEGFRLGPIFESTGFRVVKTQTNHHLLTSRNFPSLLHSMEKRKLAKMESLDPIFQQEPLSSLEEVFRFIESCRQQKQYDISLQLDDLQAMAHRFPELYFLFTLRVKEKIIAASISVRAKGKVLYNFYPAFDPEWARYSPLVHLVDRMISFCRNHGIDILDLGTSEVNGQLNPNLARFKDRIGGISSMRHQYEWLASS